MPPAPKIDTTVPHSARIWNYWLGGKDVGNDPYELRSPEQIEGFFTGRTLVDPGAVPLAEWRPDPSLFPPTRVNTPGGVGRKALSSPA
jgi:hypothetical protein